MAGLWDFFTFLYLPAALFGPCESLSSGVPGSSFSRVWSAVFTGSYWAADAGAEA